MTDIIAARRNPQVEEMDFRSAVSEATFFKLGASISFVNEYQYDTKNFFINGPYGEQGLVEGVDGLYVFPFNGQIVGVTMFSLVSGSSGSTSIDVKWLSGSGNVVGSIFSTVPSFSSSSANNSYVAVLESFVQGGGVTYGGGTGITNPVLSKTDFLAGEAIRCDLLNGMVAGENCGLKIYIRPV